MKFVSLDGWRGVCAVLVVLYHMPLLGPPFDGVFIRNSYLFVDFFFVLSGFVISYAYNTRLGTLRDVIDFGLRRFGRLWPLHFFVLVGMILMELAKIRVGGSYGSDFVPAFSGDRSVPLIFANVFLIQTLRPESMNSWNIPAWSISVEFWTYFLFAFLQLFLQRQRITIAILICLGSVAVLWIVSRTSINVIAILAFFRCFYGFFLGNLLFEVRCRYLQKMVLISFCLATVAEVVSVGAAVGFVCLAGRGQTSLLSPMMFGVVICLFAAGRGAVSSLLRSTFCQMLGRLSFSIYMLHVPLILLTERILHAVDLSFRTHFLRPTEHGTYLTFDQAGPAVAATIGFLIVLIMLSTLTFKFIEAPAMRRFNELATTRMRLSRTITGRPARQVGERSFPN